MPNHDDQGQQQNHRHVMRRMLRPIRLIVAFPVWFYQRVISPGFPSSCIYTPTCSEYTRQAILKHGLLGVILGIMRLLRCAGGLYTGGEDAVPDRVTCDYVFGSYRRFWRGRRNR